MAHRGEELRLGDVGLLGVPARLVRHLPGFLQFGDQGVLFRLMGDGLEAGGVELAREVDKEHLAPRA